MLARGLVKGRSNTALLRDVFVIEIQHSGAHERTMQESLGDQAACSQSAELAKPKLFTAAAPFDALCPRITSSRFAAFLAIFHGRRSVTTSQAMLLTATSEASMLWASRPLLASLPSIPLRLIIQLHLARVELQKFSNAFKDLSAPDTNAVTLSKMEGLLRHIRLSRGVGPVHPGSTTGTRLPLR